MQVPNVSEGRRWRLGLAAMLLAVALVIVAAAFGSTAKSSARAKGGYGEVYKANPAILKKTLFDAKLLPPAGMARNIALAAYGRASKKVDYNLALKCWKNDGCNTGTGGKLKVAYVEPFGENVYRHISKMEFILQALTYKSIGRIIYRTAHSNPTQALADFRAMIAQHVNAIVTYPDFADAELPVFKEAKKAGIPVATYAWGYVTGPGVNYTTVVGENVCKLGRAYAKIMPRFETVNVASWSSPGESVRLRAASASRRVSRAVSASVLWSASKTTGTSNASSVATAIPTLMRE